MIFNSKAATYEWVCAPACLPARLPLQKLGPMLRQRAAAVGDVLLLQPLGPGRVSAALIKADSQVSDIAWCCSCWRWRWCCHAFGMGTALCCSGRQS